MKADSSPVFADPSYFDFYFSYGLPSNAGSASVLRGLREPVFQTMNGYHFQEAAGQYCFSWIEIF